MLCNICHRCKLIELKKLQCPTITKQEEHSDEVRLHSSITKQHIENTTGSDKKLKSHRIMNIGDYCSMESGQEESTPCSHSLHLTTTASHVNRAAQKVGVRSRFMTKSPYDSTPEGHRLSFARQIHQFLAPDIAQASERKSSQM